jgi:molybdopterin-dependent oxidoreductase alpha subunit
MSREFDLQKNVQKYDSPAAGWGALLASAQTLKQEKAINAIPALVKMNQPSGFDCPGCAWPEPEKTSITEFCENGVKAIAAESTSKRVSREFFESRTVESLRSWSDYDLEQQGRLTEPMAYDLQTDRYTPISWNDAFNLIAENLSTLENPNHAVFYTSGRTSNEAAFLWQLFGRTLGTNNFPDCSNMCHESSGVALTESIGIGKGSVQLEDFEEADLIFVIGQNPGTNHPRMLSVLQQAARRGCQIVTFNPILERGLEKFIHPQEALQMMTGTSSSISTHYFQPIIGGDLALLQGLIKAVLGAEETQKDVLDKEFLENHTSGFSELKDEIGKTDWTVIESESGLSRTQIEEVASLYCNSQRVIACWAMGLTQQKHAVSTIQSIVNLLLLRGNIGRPGAGVCPVRGHSNVQGDRTVGITEHPSESFLKNLDHQFGISSPRDSGFNTVQTIQAMESESVRVFMAMGGNFARATPDSSRTEKALKKCDLTVQVTTKLNKSHLTHGKKALILPCLGRSELDVQASGEQSVTVEDSMGAVHASKGTNQPASANLKSEVAIVVGMAKATFPENQKMWTALQDDYRLIRDKIEAVLPELFSDYNKKINQPGGFRLFNSAAARKWNTETGKARFISKPLQLLQLPPGQLRLMTIRSHDQYNTTIYGMNDRYRGIFGTRRIIFMNLKDMESLGIEHGQEVVIQSHMEDGRKRQVSGFHAVRYNIPQGCAASYFPETNELIAVEYCADRSFTPISKLIPVTVHKSND